VHQEFFLKRIEIKKLVFFRILATNIPLVLAAIFGIGKADRSPQTDEELIHAFRFTWDNIHVGVLYERYAHMVFGVCMKYLRDEAAAGDAAMEVFEKLLYELKRHDVQQFKPWLYTLAKNHCLMKVRKDRTDAGRLNGYKKFVTEIMEDGEETHLYRADEKESVYLKLELALEQLKEEQRACIHLYYFEDKSYKEIELITGMDDKQVKSHLQNGKRNLKLILTGKDE